MTQSAIGAVESEPSGCARSKLRAILARELDKEILPAARVMAEHVRGLHGDTIGPILFYGSCLRAESPEGVMDLYLLTRSNRAFNPTLLLAGLNWLIPPNIYFWSVETETEPFRGKGAAVSQAQFARNCEEFAWSPSIWARFCQPAVLVDAPDAASVDMALDAIVEAVITAGRWAAKLGPEQGTSRDYWVALFRSTYAVELRPERADRPGLIYDANAARYDELLSAAWEAAGIEFTCDGDQLRPKVSGEQRRQANTAWARRRAFGKFLSAARIIKGTFTFDGAVEYLLWKIERHSGVKVEVTEWQAAHPFLAAPRIFTKLWRAGAIQ